VNFEILRLFAAFRRYDHDKNTIHPRGGYICSRCRWLRGSPRRLAQLQWGTRKSEPQSFRILFWAEADYRDAQRSLKRPDALIFLFANREVWSEQTPPRLQDESIRFVAPSVAFVDAQFVQYGSTILKSAIPVVLLLRKEADIWKMSSWRMLSCGIPISPPWA
jgi:hypothetical protein